ncbi:YihY/virulence factor BrkB family protein [Gangjinia marincola]|uniref:YihY/virulence factor BrkB family protein n=1 Tax=Gangjinia marincola TaxID=578463 RepID=A0ABP3XRD9_9FLAO
MRNPFKNIPILGWLISITQKVKLLGFEGLTLYDLANLYIPGIIKGTFATRASAIAFSFFMAIFPFILFVINLIPFVWFIDDFQAELFDFILELIPTQSQPFVDDVLLDIIDKPRAGLLSFGFLLSIFLMANGINAAFTGFEFSVHTQINRSFIRQYAVAMGVSFIVALLLFTTVISIIYLSYLIEVFTKGGFVQDGAVYAFLGRGLIVIVMIFSIVATLFYFGTKESKQSRFFSVGAIFTTLLILLFTYLFSLYIENFGSYNELYGSIGALLILMVYIWLNSNILLLGFELNASLHRLKNNKNLNPN